MFSSVQFGRSVVSDSLRPHELQHARPPCPSPTHSNSRPSSRWCHHLLTVGSERTRIVILFVIFHSLKILCFLLPHFCKKVLEPQMWMRKRPCTEAGVAAPAGPLPSLSVAWVARWLQGPWVVSRWAQDQGNSWLIPWPGPRAEGQLSGWSCLKWAERWQEWECCPPCSCL